MAYIDIDHVYDGKRFCERGRGYDDQFYGADTWFWNLQFYNTLADVAAAGRPQSMGNGANPTLQLPANPGTLDVYPFELSASNPQIRTMVNPWTNGWKLRPFHPKKAGNEALKKAVIDAMVSGGVPGVKQGV